MAEFILPFPCILIYIYTCAVVYTTEESTQWLTVQQLGRRQLSCILA